MSNSYRDNACELLGYQSASWIIIIGFPLSQSDRMSHFVPISPNAPAYHPPLPYRHPLRPEVLQPVPLRAADRIDMKKFEKIDELARKKLREPFALISKEERKIPYPVFSCAIDPLIDDLGKEKWKGYLELAKAAKEQGLIDCALRNCHKALNLERESHELWKMVVELEMARGMRPLADYAMASALQACPRSELLWDMAQPMGFCRFYNY